MYIAGGALHRADGSQLTTFGNTCDSIHCATHVETQHSYTYIARPGIVCEFEVGGVTFVCCILIMSGWVCCTISAQRGHCPLYLT